MVKTNEFIDKVSAGDKERNRTAFDRLKNYRSFLRTHVKKPPNVYSSDFLQAYRFTVGTDEIGVASLNTAWRCTGAPNDADRHFLLMGERNVDEAIRQLSGCDIKIAVFHHPTDWLTGSDQSAVLGRLFSSFDLLMCGHLHQSLSEQHFTTSGSALISQAGSLYASRLYPNSYQIVSLDLAASKATFHIRTWFDAPRRVFDAALDKAANGRFECDFYGKKKPEGNENVRRVLREAGNLIRDKEASHLDFAGEFTKAGMDARATFVCPPLSSRKHQISDANADDRERKPRDELISLEELLRSKDHIVFVSEREGGKTSIGNHIAVRVAEGLCDEDRVPFVVDFSNFLKGARGLQEDFQSYYKGASRRPDFASLHKRGELLAIVDNVKSQDKAEERIAELIKSQAPNRFLLLCDSEHLIGDPTNSKLAEISRRVHVQSLPRRAIREISKRWCQITGNDDLETNKFIVRQVEENNLPRSGYIISLLAWAHERQKKLERVNEAYLLSAVVDHLLEKADFRKSLRKEFDPVSAEITLQAIAVFVRGRITSSNELIVFLVEFFNKKRLPFNAREIVDKLIECGLLKEANDCIGFKYRCFEEYFVACHLRADAADLRQIIETDAGEYARELYLLSGLRRQNDELLRAMRKRLLARMPPSLAAADPAQLRQIAEQQIFEASSKKKLTAIKTEKVSSEVVDDLLDEAERRLGNKTERKKATSIVATKPGTATADSSNQQNSEEPMQSEGEEKKASSSSVVEFMQETSLYGGILKNSEFDDGDLKQESALFYLECTSRYSVHAIAVLKEIIQMIDLKPPPDPKSKAKVFTKEDLVTFRNKASLFMQKFVLAIVSSKISADIASEKLALVFDDLVESESVMKEQRLLMALVLYDVDGASWDAKLKKAIDLNGSAFMLDVVTERLWLDLYSRIEPEHRREKISGIVDHISSKISGPQPRQASSRQAIERASLFMQAREG